MEQEKKLGWREHAIIAVMLFGMFFGAGNLIFPVQMGQTAGSQSWVAFIGFAITGVGLPLLGIAALGISRSNGLLELSSKVGKGYGKFFTCALYLTIGPLFAIPRCASTAFTIGIEPLANLGDKSWILLLIFSLAFFGAVLAFSLYPGKILTWIGKILTPTFLVFFAVLLVVALASPSASVSEVAPSGGYADNAFFTGFLEGYNTLDALASLAFGIVVVDVIRGLGVREPASIAKNTVFSGIFSCAIMAVIYLATTIVGAQSRGLFGIADNGGIALAQIANRYLGTAGLIILAITVTFCCLKTAVALVTSCAEGFTGVFPKGPSYRVWAIAFTAFAFAIANLGLSAIISYSLPVLMFLYPLTIVLILLALFGKFFNHDKRVYAFTIGFTFVGSVYDLLANLPAVVKNALALDKILPAVGKFLPLSSKGMGWIVPAAIGLIIGLVLYFVSKRKSADLELATETSDETTEPAETVAQIETVVETTAEIAANDGEAATTENAENAEEVASSEERTT